MAADQSDHFRVARRTNEPQNMRLCGAMFALALVSELARNTVAEQAFPLLCASAVFALAGVIHLVGILFPVESELIIDAEHMRWGRVGRRYTVLQRAEIEELLLASNVSCLVRCRSGKTLGIPDEIVASDAEHIVRELSRVWPDIAVRDLRRRKPPAATAASSQVKRQPARARAITKPATD